jgi:hypothetical protein
MVSWRIANPLIETLSQVNLDVFASCGRITAYPEVSVASENVRFWEQVKCPVSSKSKIIRQSS